ncbi:MAG TPA: permease [Polyangiales bacterium]|nr:permease [Polyangiales bacterium]
MLSILISLSVLGLFAGAGLVALGRLRLGATSALEGLALGMLPALVLLRLVPHAYESLGLWALGLAALGFGAVTLSHHAGERAEARLGGALVLPALLLHAATDGAALAISNTGRVGDSAGLLALAAILHRIPEGFYVASRAHARGAKGALLAAAPLALATVAGAVFGQGIFDSLPDSALDGVLAVGAGAMLRLFLHTHDEAPTSPPPAARAIAAATLLCGVIIVIAVPGPHDVLQSAQPRELSVAQSLLPLFIESAPALLIGLVLSSLLRAPTDRLRLPAALSVSVAVAVSQLGVETLSLSWAWLGLRVTLVRAFGGAGLALLLGAAIARRTRQVTSQHVPNSEAAHQRPTVTRNFGELLQQALDDNGPFIVFGLLLSAALEAALTPELLQRLPEPWDTMLACALALFGRVSALGITPVVAVLLHKGLALGPALALLWLSPLALWLTQRPKESEMPLATIGVGAVALSVTLGELVERTLTKHGVPELHPLVAHDCSPWEYASAALLALLLVRSLMRLGPRGFASTRPPPSSERTLCAMPH